MDKIQGNYLTQSNRDFPLDAETLDYIQTNAALISAIGNIGGDKIILEGCTLAGGNRSEGYVFVKTAAAPQGEVLRFEGGAVSAGMYVKTEAIAVNALGNSYPTAYSKRSLAAGTGTETFSWSDFVEISTNRWLKGKIDELTAQIALLSPAPLGIVQMWSGGVDAGSIPDGYHLCDGAQLSATDYPALFAAIGRRHTPSSEAQGFFRLPDLKGRFIAGYNSDDDDYNAIAKTGGAKNVELTVSQMPQHTHKFCSARLQYGAESRYVRDGSEEFSTRGDSNSSTSYDYKTSSTGSGQSHENRPPYYVLAYIMRIS